MSSFPGSPRLLKGGIALLDSTTLDPVRTIALQYNPDTVTRTLQPQMFGGEGADRTEATRFKGPPVETIKVDAEIDATDQLEFPERNRVATEHGILPQLAALELILYPPTETLRANETLANSGKIEIVPVIAPLVLFIFGKSRVYPVKITDFSITEEAFDPALNPIRAKVTLGMRVLNINDLGFGRPGGLYLAYQRQKEQLRALVPEASPGDFGLQRIP